MFVCSSRRSLYEAFCLSFLTQLDGSSHPLVERAIIEHLVIMKKDAVSDKAIAVCSRNLSKVGLFLDLSLIIMWVLSLILIMCVFALTLI